MRKIREIIYSLIVFWCANFFTIRFTYKYMEVVSPTMKWLANTAIFFILLILLIAICIWPQFTKQPEKKLTTLSNGNELLIIFLGSVVLTAAYQIVTLIGAIQICSSGKGDGWGIARMIALWVATFLVAVLVESVVFWSGMLRIYTTSVQLGVNHRVWAVIVAWIPLVNIMYLMKMIHIVDAEVEIESNKVILDNSRAEGHICQTKYPILMVHGVFFRDFRYYNYWGRIPGELKKNGATIYYGEQQSAQSVEECGKELAQKIKFIVQETGCEKVNIIAHSKGGLDSRAAISHYGADAYVASLTTINTPHRGCIFAGYLLDKIPDRVRQKVAAAYNTTLQKLGDDNPDFLKAVIDLTAQECEKRNEVTPDVEGILYESVMSYCKKARSGRFPLNLSYPLVKHFDGKNDGLVSDDSASWGSAFTLIEPKGKRGISHGDMIDLNRENFSGFDVREFYVGLVKNLKERGY